MGGKTEVAAHFASPPYSILELQDPRIHRVIAASEVLGDATLDVVYAPQRFVKANPGIASAFLAAMDAACALIAADPAAAADSFIRLSAARMKPDDVLAMVRDPDTRFSATPSGVMRYAGVHARRWQHQGRAGPMVGHVRAGAGGPGRIVAPSPAPCRRRTRSGGHASAANQRRNAPIRPTPAPSSAKLGGF